MRPMRLSLLVCAGVAACGRGGPRTPPQVPVVAAVARTQDVPFEIAANGTVEPLQTASVEPQVTGIVTRVAFREGDEVEAGRLLFQIDPRPFQADVEQARAALHRDSAQADQARRDADRYAELVRQDYVTQQQFEQQRSAAAAAVGTVRADSAALTSAALNLEYSSVRAPIAGRTGSLLVREGNLVRANSPTPLVVINQIEPILVRFAVPQTSLPLIQRYRTPGTSLPVIATTAADTAADPADTGRLTFVDNAVDTTTGTVLLKALFPNRDHALWPGEFVNVRLQLYVEQRATVVPAAAVTAGQVGPFVFVVNADQTVTQRPVTVERTAGALAVIRDGVKAGEIVVTDGQLRLATGSHVSVTHVARADTVTGADR